jgi:hypothetical protein
MESEEQSKPDQGHFEYDIARLLEYNGPGFRQKEPIADGVSLFDYVNTDENERNISILLSSQGIPFNIERPEHGWAGVKTRLILTVPRTRQPQAEAILSAAVEQSVVEKGEGTEGLISY